MKKMKFMAFAMSLLMIVGCGTATGNGALIGGGGGAAVGAGIGALLGKGKGALIGAAIGGAVGTGAGALIGKKMDKAKAAAAQVNGAQVESVTDANGLQAVKVSFDNGILFKVGKSDLQAGAMTSLRQFAQNVLNANPDLDVDIKGFASSDGSEETNLKLSQKRAESVSTYLTNCGVAAKQIKSTLGYGEDPTFLVYDANGKENQAASRRVEVYLYASQAMIEQANNGTLQ